VPDPDNRNNLRRVISGVEYSVVANSNTVDWFVTYEPFGALRMGIR
jgi:hypothetical protein